jgi:hypothetical protein
MKPFFRYGLGALICALGAGGVLMHATGERLMAEAESRLAVSDLASADRAFAEVADRTGILDQLPWLLSDRRAEAAAHRARIRYWQGDYAQLLEDYDGFTSTDATSNVGVQLTLANAVYRIGQHPDGNRAVALDALDLAIGRYLQLVQTSDGRRDVAFNYEFLVRLRNEIAAGSEWTPQPLEYPLGQEGQQPMDSDTEIEDLQIFVPMEHNEREEIEDPTLGGDPPVQRRG